MADTLFTDATSVVPGTPIISSWLNDVNSETYSTLASVAGTNTITAVGPLSYTTYRTGSRFFFLPAVTNTGAVTININGLGARAITKFGTTPLVAGDLPTTYAAEIYYDGTQFQLLNPRNTDVSTVTGTLPITNGGTGAITAAQALINLGATGRLIGRQLFTATGPYTPTTGTTFAIISGCGSGGGGGGTHATAAGQVAAASGGGAGGGGTYFWPSPTAQTITIGAAGTAGAPSGAGGSGGACSVGAILSFTGGSGGGVGTAGSTIAAGNPAGNGAVTTALTGYADVGKFGSPGWASTSVGLAAKCGGASSAYGTGAPSTVGGGGPFPGAAATGFGSGGSGAAALSSQAANAGGAGTAGFIVIYEYS